MARRPRQFGEAETDEPAPILGLPISKALESSIEAIAKDNSVSIEQLLNQALAALQTGQRRKASDPDLQASAEQSANNTATAPASIIRKRVQVLQTSNAIISSLQEVLEYDPSLQHNQLPPELWIDNIAYISAIGALVAELRQLNELLQKQATPQQEHNTVLDLGMHLNKFFDNFSEVMGRGAGWLLIASCAGLLYQTGLIPDLADKILRHLPKLLR